MCLFATVLLPAAGKGEPSKEFLENRPKTFRNDNRTVWLDAEQRPDDDIYTLTRRATFETKEGRNEFALQVAGDLDPFSRFVRLDASAKVVNPKVLTDSCIDTSSPASVAAALCKPGMSDREKAIAIWYFLADKLFWAGNPVEHIEGQLHYSCDPTIVLNSYGYSECSNLGPLEVAYWRAAGLKARKVRNGHDGKIFHSMAEVFYDGDWHLMDLTQLAYYLERDDKTIASGADLCKDPELVLRMVNETGFDPTWCTGDYVASKFGQMFGGGTTALPGSNYKEWTFPPEHKMDIVLLPGERFQRNWSNEGFYWNAWENHAQKKYTIEEELEHRRKRCRQYFANGSLTYRLDPKVATFRSFLHGGSKLVVDPEGTPPCRTSQPSQEGTFILPIDSSYVITDLSVKALVRRPAAEDRISVTYSVDGGKSYLPLLQVKETGEEVAVVAEVPILRGMYHVLVKFSFLSGGAEPCGLRSAEVRARLQNNPRSLPGLKAGENKIAYESASQEGSAALSYVYVERHKLPLALQWPDLRRVGPDAVFLADLASGASIPIKFQNTGGEKITLKPIVTHAPEGWRIDFSREAAELEPGQETGLTLRCKPPANAGEGIVGAEIDLQPNGTPARKRLLLCVMKGAIFFEAEGTTRNALSTRRDKTASGGLCVGQPTGKKGFASYVVNVPRDGDYTLVTRIGEVTKYARETSFRFALGGKEPRDVGVDENNIWRSKLDNYTKHWAWRMHKEPFRLKAGPHRLVVTALSPTTYLDCFALVSDKQLAMTALLNPLYCPTGFDEALAPAP